MKKNNKTFITKRILINFLGGLLIFLSVLIIVSIQYSNIYSAISEKPIMDEEKVKDGHFWIVIPEINVDSLVFNNVSRHTLKRGVAHVPGSGFPGEGTNIIIVGHLYNPSTAFRPNISFGLLDNLRKGDLIYIAYDKKEIVYEVSEKNTLDADDPELYVLTDTECLTLLTCKPLFHDTKRLKVTALPYNVISSL